MVDDPVPGDTVGRLRAELAFMYELCQVVASHSDLQPILDWVVRKTTGMLHAEEGTIHLIGPDAANPAPRTLIRREQPGLHAGSWPRMVSLNVMGFLMTHGGPLVSPDLLEDPRFPALHGMASRVRSVLAVPLRVDKRFTGMLAVTTSNPGHAWTDDEAQLLAIVAGNSAGVIEQAHLKVIAEEKRRLEEQQKRIEHELDTARGIQMNLVPARALRFGRWEAFGRVMPANHVGGDGFDYFPVASGRMAVAIADVSGKGVPAALLMAGVQASLRAYCDGRTPIADAIAHVNAAVARSAGGKFITLFYGEIDPDASVLHYVNAGHNYPLVLRANGTLEPLAHGGLPLGILEDAAFEPGECRFAEDDMLLLYSDGITEQLDDGDHEFGEDRLRASWSCSHGEAPAATIERLFAEVARFQGRIEQHDDMTMVVVAAAG